MTQGELTQHLRKMNRAGTTITVYSDGDKTLQTMPDSIIPLRIDGDHFWLLLKSIDYHEQPQRCQTIKVVDHLVNAYLEDKDFGVQWLIATLQDDRNRLYLIETIEPFCEPEAHQKWRKWLRYRKDNRGKFKTLDAEILKQHQFIADTWNT